MVWGLGWVWIHLPFLAGLGGPVPKPVMLRRQRSDRREVFGAGGRFRRSYPHTPGHAASLRREMRWGLAAQLIGTAAFSSAGPAAGRGRRGIQKTWGECSVGPVRPRSPLINPLPIAVASFFVTVRRGGGDTRVLGPERRGGDI